MPANNPANRRHGGVGLFYINSLHIIVRNYLSFDESTVIELKFGRKKIFFTVLYRSPANDHNSPVFQAFLSNFRNLYTKIKAENPFTDTTAVGMEVEHPLSSLVLSQVISEPTNFEPNKNPSCIVLIITDQPNHIFDCGIRSSLDHFCHHEIV